jgi:2,4-dienoyl-CoA reductase-like NADH-dependent reductase (Old Yellow Enzyme family)
MTSLLRQIENHLRQTGMTPTRFGRESVRDPRLVHDLKNGREPGRSICARVIAYLGKPQ